jgi:hypothetical protein
MVSNQQKFIDGASWDSARRRLFELQLLNPK